jgi:hypothetical protein
MLYNVSPRDPLAFGLACFVMAIVALIALFHAREARRTHQSRSSFTNVSASVIKKKRESRQNLRPATSTT